MVKNKGSGGGGGKAKKARTTGGYTGTTGRANVRTGGFTGMELKFLDSGKSTSISTGAPVAAHIIDPTSGDSVGGLANVGVGTGPSQRDGRKYVVKSLWIRGMVWLTTKTGAASALDARTVRLVVVHDRQTNGAAPTILEIFNTATPGTLAMQNLEYSQRYKILVDKTMTLEWTAAANDAAATGTYSGQAKPFSIYKGKLNIPVTSHGTGGTGAIADISDNSLHILAFASDADCNVNYVSRVRFVG